MSIAATGTPAHDPLDSAVALLHEARQLPYRVDRSAEWAEVFRATVACAADYLAEHVRRVSSASAGQSPRPGSTACRRLDGHRELMAALEALITEVEQAPRPGLLQAVGLIEDAMLVAATLAEHRDELRLQREGQGIDTSTIAPGLLRHALQHPSGPAAVRRFRPAVDSPLGPAAKEPA